MAFFVLATLTLLVGSSVGYQTFQTQIPNGNNVPHPCKANYMWPGVGHENRMGGGVNNVFGEHFKDIGYWWSQDLCWKDSDGDGKTNGEELGDPECRWMVGQVPERTSGITHPGICDPFDSPECQARNEFVKCELEGFVCPRINASDVKYIDMPFKEITVPATETNYFCMTFDLPTDQDYHVIANEPIIDNLEVLHHIVVYACNSANGSNIPTPQECGMEAEEDGDCGTIIGLWTVGSAGLCYADNIGYRIGKTSFKKVKLELHYNNPRMDNGQRDSSGIRLYYQPAREEVEDLVTLTLGARLIELPPGQSRIEVPSVCKGSCTSSMVMKPAKIFGALNHMHYLGSSMKIELFRDGRKVGDISNDDFYSYDSPVVHTHSPSMDLFPGDEIKTTCVYNTMSVNHYTHFGEATSDEMCYGFLFVYPKDALRWAACTTWDSFDVCDLYGGRPIETERGDCNLGAFTHFDDDYSPMWVAEAKKHCSMDGWCRPHCKELVEEMMQQHPCMHKDAEALVTWRLSESHPGTEVLARINACKGALYAGGMDHGEGGKDSGMSKDQGTQTCSWDDCQWMCPVDGNKGDNYGGDQKQIYDAAAPKMGASWLAMMLAAGCFVVFTQL